MRLTDLQIKKLKPPEKGQKTYFDASLSGFGVRVSQGGSKSFVVMYGEKRRLKTLGRYPDLSLKEAREQAKHVQSEPKLKDTADHAKLRSVSFSDARERFLKDTEARTKQSTVDEYRRLLTKHFKFTKSLSDLTRSDVMKVIEQLTTTPSEKQHAFVAVRTMMNWCCRHGLVELSPVPPLRIQQTERSRILTDDELKMVWQRAEQVGYPYGTLVQLLILTGQRRGEIAGLRWSWICKGIIVFPEGFTKNKREHSLPIGVRTQAIISTIPKQVIDEQTSDLLFPARGKLDTSISGWSKYKKAFDKPLEIAPYTLHDLRRTYSSNLARIGAPIHVTEKLLNHVSGTISGVAAVYNRHNYFEEMRDAIHLFEDEFSQIIG